MALVGVVREETMKKPWLELTPQHELVIAEEVAFATQLAEQWQLPVLTTMRLMCSLGERYAPHSSELQAIRWCLEHPDDYEHVAEGLERKRRLAADKRTAKLHDAMRAISNYRC